MFKKKPKPDPAPLAAATAEREQVKRLFSAMSTELEQTSARVDIVIARLKRKADGGKVPLRLVRSAK